MPKFIPNFKTSYQRIPVEKATKAMGSIVDKVKISSLSTAQKMRFKKQFASDCLNKNIGNARGDGMIDQKSLNKVLKKAVDRKTIPDIWITERYKKLLVKGGTTLSKWETKPSDSKPETVQKKLNSEIKPSVKLTLQSSSVTNANEKKIAIEERKKFHEELEKKISARREQRSVTNTQLELQEKEKSGEVKTARYQTETARGPKEQDKASDKNAGKLKSGGKERTSKTGSKGFSQGSAGVRTGMTIMSRGLPSSVARPKRKAEVTDADLAKFNKVNLNSGLSSEKENIKDDSGNSSKKSDWRFAAYTRDENDPKIEPHETQLNDFGGQKNDSFGVEE